MIKGNRQIHIRCGNERLNAAMYKRVNANSVAVATVLKGEEFKGSGQNTKLALVALQRNLPENCRIEACISCRYGNFCPIGDVDNEIFCLCDVHPRDRNDVLYYTVNEHEIERRKRQLIYVCDSYEPLCPEEEYYAYNSFLEDISGRKE